MLAPNRSTLNDPPKPSVRVCKECLRSQPLDSFSRAYPDQQYRLRTCKQCRLASERKRIARIRKRAHDASIRKFEKQVLIAKDEAIDELVVEMMKRYGGSNGFADAWFQSHCNATANRKLRSMEAILRLSAYRETREKESDREIARMDENAIEQEMHKELEKLIKQNPQIAIEAARRLGWKVEPQGQ